MKFKSMNSLDISIVSRKETQIFDEYDRYSSSQEDNHDVNLKDNHAEL